MTAVAAYLRRLRLDPEPPSVDGLQRLIAAHVTHVPYETLWLYLGERRGISPAESYRHLVTEGRGGYCYMLNGAFSRLLRGLGYDARIHRSTVHGPEAPLPTQRHNHAALVVHGLPTADNSGGRWLADAGLGDGPPAALPMIDGPYRDGPYTWTIGRPAYPGFDDQVLHGPNGSFHGFGIGAEAPTMRPFMIRHRFLSTSPDSGFRKVVVAQRREGGQVVTLRGLGFSRIGSRRRDESVVEGPDDWFALLADEFGIDLGGVPARQRQRLWRTVHGQHEAWAALESAGG